MRRFTLLLLCGALLLAGCVEGDYSTFGGPATIASKVKISAEDRARGYMGLAYDEDDSDAQGVAIVQVILEGPAELAGLKAGDRVCQLNGNAVNSAAEAYAITKSWKPGMEVSVVVLRAEEELAFIVPLVTFEETQELHYRQFRRDNHK